MSDMNKLIKQLLQTRQDKNISQSELGKMVGLPQSHISKIESGKCDLRLSGLLDIAHNLGYELKLVPRELSMQVEAMISGNKLEQEPRWQPDQDGEES